MEKFKVLFIFLLSFCISTAVAQQYTPMTAAGYAMKRVKVDSTLHLPSFCGVPTLRNSTAINGALAMDTCNNKLYKWTNQSGWSVVGQIIDTTIYVKYSDTSAMLAPYAQTIYVDAQLATKLNISDTANKWITNVYRKTATDSVFYVKGGNSTFAFTDSTGGGQNGRFGNDTATIVMAKVHNDAGSQLTNGEVVFLATSGTNSDAPSVKRAKNTGDSTSANTFGFVSGTINANDTGWVILSGKIEKLNTVSFSNGDIIYLDSIAGKWTKSKPKAPYHLVYLGVVVKSNAGNGSIFVKPQNGYELDEIHDVQINGVTNNQILVYSDTQKLWKNRSVYSVVDTTSLSNRINLKVNISDTANKWVTRVYRKTASDSVFYVKGGTNTFAFRDSIGGTTINPDAPSSQIGLTAINGVFGTYMRSDAAPALSQTIAPTWTGLHTFSRSATASGAIARGTYMTPTLIAAANNDVLVGLDVNPTFTNGAFTGVSNLAARFNGAININSSSTIGINLSTIPSSNNGGTINQYTTANNRYSTTSFYNSSNTLGASFGYADSLVAETNLRDAFLLGGRKSTSKLIFIRGTGATQSATMFSNGNWLIQDGGTHTDAGYKLDVNGTARVQGAIGIETSSSSTPFFTHKFSNAQTFSLTRDGNYGTAIGSWDGASATRCLTLLNNSVGVGLSATTIASTAVLDVQSTTKGFLPPRMTTTQRTAITSPAEGLTVYDLTLHKLYVFDGTIWQAAW